MNKLNDNHNLVSPTRLFANAGIPAKVIYSPKLCAAFQIPDQPDAPERLELAWVVRGILTGLLPSREFETPLGCARLAEYPSIDNAEADRRVVVVTEVDSNNIQVLLPEELNENAGAKLVLVVDDNPDLRNLAVMLIETTGAYRPMPLQSE